ncbi:hypothetical protein [Aureibacter tunicatorum]|uniref:Uncharacterized protein n=1 Tax=Aureibacter tunicatorum TaxID=866807 RepID=A0AAE4BSY5_9BACT|nr:hypothetical protein [Aureibacter tunicatorum]MDR6240266.1 hypothetical protein [Aureibacter tunicatorum]BDD05853.1 hypothetical protein AUTU_33360 [Aureibacter tunicatorum]
MGDFKKYANPWDAKYSEWYAEGSATWIGEGVVATAKAMSCDQKKVKELKKKFESMIENARNIGQNVAADNLQHFLNGSGSTRTLSVSWLRSFASITNAESRILNYTKNRNLNAWVKDVEKGKTVSKSDYWDADIKNYNMSSELSYASGASDMKGNVEMRLSRSEDIIDITGTVNIRWSDDYNWNKGMGFYIPGTGWVSDSDGLYLEKCGGAKSFLMEAFWRFDYTGKYDFENSKWMNSSWKINGSEYTPNENSSDSNNSSGR